MESLLEVNRPARHAVPIAISDTRAEHENPNLALPAFPQAFCGGWGYRALLGISEGKKKKRQAREEKLQTAFAGEFNLPTIESAPCRA